MYQNKLHDILRNIEGATGKAYKMSKNTYLELLLRQPS